jgi:hypothetical protein
MMNSKFISSYLKQGKKMLKKVPTENSRKHSVAAFLKPLSKIGYLHFMHYMCTSISVVLKKNVTPVGLLY